ncbi:MAG TPA: hypothetical protein VJ436_03755 [Anaerolineales bacterium]|nr:hypothetical protein [Anaerolineales bacterium]
MVKAKKPTGRNSKARKELTPLVVYVWAFGLGMLGYLLGRIMLDSLPHPVHWSAGLLAGVAGYFIGWAWYRWRGDVI